MAKSRSLNKVILIGNLTRDPILRESSNGVVVCTFGIATNTSWKDGDGNVQERAEFHNIVAFNKLAEICAQVLSTGMLVYVEGELRTRAKTKEDGEKYYKTEIKLNDMLLLNSKDRSPVGVDAAKEAGDDLMDKMGDESLPAENLDAKEESAPENDDDDADEFDAKDLF
ncbi:single-stranded DNA-binding protein [Candidatus Dojkabacteria bacterium]|uniref:Single-stranded DNA-binding protein n=1 Tax=Candidatus Dojkabacteria bacterium TaxID=2099670 RepID=A0A955I9N5_9BACT|nr:single-stranded DNA-binding protein [Candidatus Dojkabacteria bacterium]